MYKLLPALLSVALLAGCEDPQAAKHARFRLDLSEALELAREARQGFVPASAQAQGADRRLVLEAFRQERVQEVIDRLTSLSRGTAPSPQEQAAVKRLLSDFEAASARHQCRTATTRWSELANDSNELLRLMMRIDDAASRGNLAETGDGDLVTDLNKRKTATINEHRHYQKVVDEQSIKIAELEQEIGQFEEQKANAVLETSRLRERAFTARGAAHYDLHQQGDDFERAAAAAETRIQRLSLQRYLYHSEREISGHHMHLAADTRRMLDRQNEQATKRHSEMQKFREQARTEKDSYSEQMYGQFEVVNDHYARDVQKALDEAAGRTAKAVELCAEALRLDRRGRQTNQLNLMTAYLTYLHIVTRQVAISGSYGRTLSVLAEQADRLVRDRASSLRHTAEEIAAKQAELIEKAADISRTATELAEELSDSGDERIAEMAQEHKRTIEAYGKTIADVKLK